MSGPLGSQQWMYATGEQAFYPYQIDNSLRFDGASYLYRTPGTTSDRKKWTVSTWVKRSALGGSQAIFGVRRLVSGTLDNQTVLFISNDSLRSFVFTFPGSGTIEAKVSAPVLRDAAAWYHIVWVFDSANSTADYRTRIYVNGVEAECSYDAGPMPVNTESYVNVSGMQHSFGAKAQDFATVTKLNFLGGYQADSYLIDGQALTPSSFGETKNGVWIPKAYTGSYGTNGFHLDFADSASLGNDVSGNDNDFTASGIVASDQMLDTPTNNFATLNPLDTATTGTLSNGNLVTSGNAKVTMRPTSGQWYYEKDGVGVSYDADTSGEFNPTLTAGSYNFGQSPWSDTGPTGSQKALCTANLPAPTFDPAVGASPQDAFNVYTDTGANILSTAQGDYSDGLFWIKDYQNDLTDHQLLNTVTDTVLESNTTDAERAYSAPSGASVAWSWKLGGDSDTFNIDGVGYTTASAAGLDGGAQNPTAASVNTTAGIGIYKYAGNNAVSTIAHGLGVLPKIVLLKNLTLGGNGWLVYTNAIDGSMDYGSLEGSGAFGGSGRALTSTTFDHGAGASQGASGSNYLACVFAEKEGFSKFGAFTGNGVADGPFVYLGFRPAFVMVKSTGIGGWYLLDAAREGYNPDNDYLQANNNLSENASDTIDLLSNGFKVRSSDYNVDTVKYFYMAFAEQPFKFANAR